MTLSPVALFVYNRPEHTAKTIKALSQNELAKESELFIFSDGPKNETETIKIQEVRNYLKTITRFKKITIIEKPNNSGLANSIIKGVTEVVNKYGKVIVLEDDLVTSPYFLKYMNEALALYENEDKVISVHGYIYPIKAELPETFFLKGADCWGWATWKRGWNLFEPDGKKLLAELRKKNLFREFNFNNTQAYSSMLKDQIEGKNDSWAIRWHASAFLDNKLTLYPGRSLVKNIGLDSTGFHPGTTKAFDTQVAAIPISVAKTPPEENTKARKEFEKFFKSLRPGVFSRAVRKIKKLIQPRKYGYFGVYKNWGEAQKNSTGYDSDIIIEKTKEAALKVRRGEAAYERDSVIFDEIEPAWPILATLLRVASGNSNFLNVLDFGGALGTSYYQNKNFLKSLKLNWSIVEQKKFVDYGKKFFEDGELRFYYSVKEYGTERKPDIVLLSSVLQYLEKPYEELSEIIKLKPKLLIFDKTPFLGTGQDLITVQRVPKHIYDASYPSRVFSLNKFRTFLENKNYRLTNEFNSHKEEMFRLKNQTVDWLGLIFELKNK